MAFWMATASGKTVVLSDIMRHFRSEEKKKDGWMVFDLSSARDPVKTLISYLSLEKEVKAVLLKENSSINVTVPFVNAEVDLKNSLMDDEVRLEQLLEILIRSGKRILIGIDDIAKTDAVTEFCSVYAKLIRNTVGDSDDRFWPLYLICSGVYHNFHELGESKNLTFFKRASEVNTEPLSLSAMTVKYEDYLEIPEEKAIELARLTKGFAYAYQVVGSSFFENRDRDSEYALKHAKSELFSQCYEKIWSEIPEGEREILRIVSDGAKTRKEVIAKMKHGGSYQVFSNNLKKMGLLVSSANAYGRAELSLPFFGEFIIKYC